MKVEYPLQLFKNFNKRIWSNKNFSYFIVALVIGFTILLKSFPELYYKYIMNPVLLLVSIMIIIIITIYNFQLGLILTVSLISLYYPAKYYQIEELENFENISPIDKSDKNIVDGDESTQSANESEEEDSLEENSLEENIEIIEKKVTEEDEEEDEEDEDDDEETETKNQEINEKNNTSNRSNNTSTNLNKEQFSSIRLEKLNPSYFINKSSNSSNRSNNSYDFRGSKASNNRVLQKPNFEKNSKTKVIEKLTDVKEKKNSKTKKDPEASFLGEVRNIFKDLDTGKNNMKAKTAIKKINDLMYNKHKTDIQQILNEDEEDDTEDESDGEYF
jgi:hypothetical protein